MRTAGKFKLFDRIFGRNISIKPVGDRKATQAEQKVIDSFKGKEKLFTARTHLGRKIKFGSFLRKACKGAGFNIENISWQVGQYSTENPRSLEDLNGHNERDPSQGGLSGERNGPRSTFLGSVPREQRSGVNQLANALTGNKSTVELNEQGDLQIDSKSEENNS